MTDATHEATLVRYDAIPDMIYCGVWSRRMEKDDESVVRMGVGEKRDELFFFSFVGKM